MNHLGTAKLVVEKMFAELDSRGGFDHWWDEIEEGIQDDILDTVTLRVESVLEAVYGEARNS